MIVIANMPRYCAVKVCKSRGGTASKDNKRISFYPFPLQDKARLQRWVDNMRRDEWTPSRHQYLCSAHFTEECFDVRWGIRYLKNTAVPTIFPSSQADGEGGPSVRKTSKPRMRPCSSEIHPVRAEPLPSKKPIILRRTRLADVSNDNLSTPDTVVHQSDVPTASGRRLSSCLSEAAFDETLPSETHAEGFGRSSRLPGDAEGALPSSSSVPSGAVETQQADSTTSEMTVLHCESLGPLSERQTLPACPLAGQTFRIIPVELKGEGQPDDPSFREWVGPGEAEPMWAYEHSYSRQDTDREQLWSRIMSLHAKIVELDRREETTVAKIQALEGEIAHLKRDSVVFNEKQRVLEDYISSVLL